MICVLGNLDSNCPGVVGAVLIFIQPVGVGIIRPTEINRTLPTVVINGYKLVLFIYLFMKYVITTFCFMSFKVKSYVWISAYLRISNNSLIVHIKWAYQNELNSPYFYTDLLDYHSIICKYYTWSINLLKWFQKCFDVSDFDDWVVL